MRRAEEMKNLIKGVDIETNARTDKVVLDDVLSALEESKRGKSAVIGANIWRIIMKSRITRVAAAAVIIGAVMVILDRLGGRIDVESVAWAEVVEAMKDANNVHITETLFSRTDGSVTAERQVWIKNRRLYRDERKDKCFIDNDKDRLILDKEHKTAKRTESYSAHLFTPVRLVEGFPEEVGRFRRLPVPEESTSEILVYRFANSMYQGKAWIDAESRLPLYMTGIKIKARRYVGMSVPAGPESRIWSDPDWTEEFEYIFDYEPIPDETFSMAVPSGYTSLN